MGFQRYLLAATALAALVSFAPVASAQNSGSMQAGDATLSVGAGTAILDLPAVKFGKLRVSGGGAVTGRIKSNDNFIREYGWNVNGSIAVPWGANKTVSLNGFRAKIDDNDTVLCSSVAGAICAFNSIVFGTAGGGNPIFEVNETGAIVSRREVDHWGVSLESKRRLTPGVMGVTRAPRRRYFAMGAEVRGIDQKLELVATRTGAALPTATLNESLDTRYYGGYLAWGGYYSLPFLSGMSSGLGLSSTFMLRGGVYYAGTDYDGVSALPLLGGPTSRLSLSRSGAAFIGGLVLETSKQFGPRTTLSLKSEYEVYSYVPDMRYNDGTTGPNFGTSIGSAGAFSARTSLRLTIKLGPDSVFEEPLK